MRIRRLVPLLLVGLMLPVVIPGGTSRAGAQTEVDRAADAAARAAAERAEAQGIVEAWAARRGTVQDQVVATLFSLEQTNRRLESVAFDVFDLRQEIFDAEARVRDLREITEERAVAAYMNGSSPGALSLWSASNFEETALLEETVASAQRADATELSNLATERDHLADLQAGFEQNQEQIRVLREDIKRETHALQDLFAVIDAEYAASFAGLEQADEAFRRAVSEVEAAERRRAALAGVETWRPLVQQYFPEDLVEQALRVMRCESGGNPDAVHPDSDASGLFQFLAGTWAFASIQAGFPAASRFDAEANVAAAAWLVGYSIRTGHPGGAWGHWVCQPEG
jgi:predicted  nucleic acid-binding Zn-ribbon protein